MHSPQSADAVPGPAFSAGVTRSRDAVTVAFFGEVDLASAAEAERWILEVEQPVMPLLEVDLRGVTFIDSTGLKVLLQANRRAEETHRRLTVVCPADGPVRRLLDLAGVAQRLELVRRASSEDAR